MPGHGWPAGARATPQPDQSYPVRIAAEVARRWTIQVENIDLDTHRRETRSDILCNGREGAVKQRVRQDRDLHVTGSLSIRAAGWAATARQRSTSWLATASAE